MCVNEQVDSVVNKVLSCMLYLLRMRMIEKTLEYTITYPSR